MQDNMIGIYLGETIITTHYMDYVDVNLIDVTLHSNRKANDLLADHDLLRVVLIDSA